MELLALLAGLLTGAVVSGAAAWKLASRREYRLGVATAEGQIAMKALTFPKGETVIFGDSLTSQAWFPGDILNAGVSGTCLPIEFGFVDRVVSACDPSLVILAWGVNGAASLEPERLIGRYQQLVRHLARPCLIVGIWPAPARPADTIRRVNDGLRRLAADTGNGFIEPPETADTRDGLHLTPEAHVERVTRIVEACQPSIRMGLRATGRQGR